eukprot:g418.t1
MEKFLAVAKARFNVTDKDKSGCLTKFQMFQLMGWLITYKEKERKMGSTKVWKIIDSIVEDCFSEKVKENELVLFNFNYFIQWYNSYFPDFFSKNMGETGNQGKDRLSSQLTVQNMSKEKYVETVALIEKNLKMIKQSEGKPLTENIVKMVEKHEGETYKDLQISIVFGIREKFILRKYKNQVASNGNKTKQMQVDDIDAGSTCSDDESITHFPLHDKSSSCAKEKKESAHSNIDDAFIFAHNRLRLALLLQLCFRKNVLKQSVLESRMEREKLLFNLQSKAFKEKVNDFKDKESLLSLSKEAFANAEAIESKLRIMKDYQNKLHLERMNIENKRWRIKKFERKMSFHSKRIEAFNIRMLIWKLRSVFAIVNPQQLQEKDDFQGGMPSIANLAFTYNGSRQLMLWSLLQEKYPKNKLISAFQEQAFQIFTLREK